MGVRILSNGDDAIMYSSSTDWAFGPVVSSDSEHGCEERIDLFLEWLPEDPRVYEDHVLETKYNEFLKVEEELWKKKEEDRESD